MKKEEIINELKKIKPTMVQPAGWNQPVEMYFFDDLIRAANVVIKGTKNDIPLK